MRYRLAINGYGRIGRCVLRALYEAGLQESLQIVAINEPADSATIAHLTKYDSTHGKFPGEVSLSEDGQTLRIYDDAIHISHCESLSELNWLAADGQPVDLVLECSGRYTDRDSAELMMKAGARRVLFSQPADADMDATVVYGVNQQSLEPEHQIISNASCSTNCIVPVIQLLDRAFGIESGTITTIHSAMNDQPVIDAYHHTDLRKTRAAGQSIIPVDTGLAKGIGRILPEMEGRFTAQALRVPTWNVSAMDLVVQVKRATSDQAVNQVLQSAARQELAGIMGYSDEPLASCDFNHDLRSVIVDASQTRVSLAENGEGRLVKVLCWFDNEWAYSNRMLDVTQLLQAFDN